MGPRLPRGIRARGGGDRHRPACGTAGAAGPRGLAGGGGIRCEPAARSPRGAHRGSAAGRRARVRRGDGTHRARAVARARRGAPGCRGAGGGRRSRRLGAGEHRDIRLADRPAGGGPPRPDHPAGWRPREGHRRPREPLRHDAADRADAGVHGPARAGPVRPRTAVRRDHARPAVVRGREHPPDGAIAGPAAGPVPDLDRPARDHARLRVRGAPMAAPVPRLSPGAATVRLLARRLDDEP